MALRFIGGKPRGGKTLRAVWFLVEELRNTRRHIVTNLALIMDALQVYLIEQGIDVNVYERITLLSPEQTREFYLYRGGGVVLERTGKEFEPLDVTPLEKEPWAAGTCYFIDECHVYFPSHNWQKIAEEVLWYVSQHGKLGDDIWCISQAIGNVAKGFRDLAQEFRYVRNHRKEKFGRFKGGNGFSERVFLSMLKETDTDRPPVEEYKYDLDVAGIASCYDTSAGVGVGAGRNADKGRDAKGIPIWTIWVAFAVVMVGLWVLADYVPQMLRKGLSATISGTLATGAKQLPLPVDANGYTVSASNRPPPTLPATALRPAIEAVAPTGAHLARDVNKYSFLSSSSTTTRAVGYMVRDGRGIVVMSDGSSRLFGYAGIDDGVSEVNRNSVTVDGVKHFLRPEHVGAPRVLPRVPVEVPRAAKEERSEAAVASVPEYRGEGTYTQTGFGVIAPAGGRVDTSAAQIAEVARQTSHTARGRP